MSAAARAQMEFDIRRLREISESLREHAPAAAMKVSSLATEVELRIKRQEALQ